MKKIVSYKDWSDFPKIHFSNEGNGDVTTTSVTYKDKVLNVGDDLIWVSNEGNEREEFKVEGIRLNPTIRVWDKTNTYYLVCNCQKEYDDFDNHC